MAKIPNPCAPGLLETTLKRMWWLLAILVVASAFVSSSFALTSEEATQVGGDLTSVERDINALGEQLSEFRASLERINQAVPQATGALSAAFQAVRDGHSARDLHVNLLLLVSGVGGLFALMFAFRVLTRRWRNAFLTCPMRARGALGLLVLDSLRCALFVACAYFLTTFLFAGKDLQMLMIVAILWGLVRWRLFDVFLDIALRPRVPAFRPIAMSDRAARQLKFLFSGGALIGMLGISVMPVLLRAGLPVPVGQVVVLAQGVVVAVACELALWCFRSSHMVYGRTQQLWFWFGAVSLGVIWVVWNVSVVALEFSVFHSLLYSLRIASIAYVVHALLDLSAHAHWWIRLTQHSVNAAAVLALSITLAQLWLVDRLQLLSMARWEPIRHSLITASVTLFVGFVAWRFLDLWTEQRLRAASPGLAPGVDDDIAAEPASRLTTLLPLVRISVGIGILILVAFLALSQLGVNITTLLAGAGVFGLAISFGSQALVRDIVAGIFFMSDDAFRVGEYIDTGRLKGTVERVTLRSVRLRHHNGQIHTIPFGQLQAITNFSRDWQTVKFNLRLARDTDLEKTRKTVKRVGQEMLQDEELGKEFLLPLKLQGMAEITDNALVVRLKFTVLPSNPSVVQREALKRLHRAFAQDGIEFAAGIITVQPFGQATVPADHGAAAAGVAMAVSAGVSARIGA
jgi:small-conductance mechanosensitive channel